MALSALLEPIFQIVGEIFFEGVFYFTGKILIPIVSLGNWHTTSKPVNPKFQSSKYLGLFIDDGRKTVSMEGQSLIGLMFYILVLAAFLIYAIF